MQEFLRYFVSSALALGVDVGSLTLLTSVFKVPYLYSGAIAFILGLTVIYLLSIWWVFEHRLCKNWRVEFMIFALIGIVGLGLNELVLWTLTSLAGMFYLFSKLASVAVVFAWNFVARKWLLFNTSSTFLQHEV